MIPPIVMQMLATLAIVCNMSLAPVLPEPMPEAMTAQAVLEPEMTMREMLACGIYNEAGGDACSDKCRKYVGDVMLNRVEDERFPDNLYDVLTAPAQYGRFATTGIKWPERAKEPGEAHAVERAYRIADELLAGEHSELYGQGYIWQAEFVQGTEGFWCDGLYFGR